MRVAEAGTTRFMGHELELAAGVLVPREETELLGRTALTSLEALGDGAQFVDMCCGAGNLACSLAAGVPRARGWACDLTGLCVELARRNVAALGLTSRVQVLQGDLFAPLVGLGLEGQIDLVVCNPPYISTGKLLGESAHLLEHEPREAFDGGPFGLSIHQRVIKQALPFLRPGGLLLFEFGLRQERQLQLLFERSRAYSDLEFFSDATGAPRVVRARK